jgi:trehalose 6-phosphate synthase
MPAADDISNIQLCDGISSLRNFVNKERAHNVLGEWSEETLQLLLRKSLLGKEIFVVSNREPYTYCRTADVVSWRSPASGVVTALEPIMLACAGTWIAQGTGNADRAHVDAMDRLKVPPNSPTYHLRRVWLSNEEHDGYYHGFANEGLWPLCHMTFVQPVFRAMDWTHYGAVNEKFADTVARESRRADPIILVQDYHFGLLPALIRRRLPNATIVLFWHIPWPAPDIFDKFPWKSEFIDGLLGSSILGFQTLLHCQYFLESVARFSSHRIDPIRGSIAHVSGETYVRSYPISIEWPPAALAAQRSISDCRSAIRARLGIERGIYIGLGVDRLDYTKGLLERFGAIERFFETFPEWIGRFVFVQIAAPTRSRLGVYREHEEHVRQAATQINERYGTAGYKPVVLEVRHCDPAEVYELYRGVDVCMVSSLHDGMNLVAKEFVAAREDEQGALVLSIFAGASEELTSALIVNPYDALAVAKVMDHALRMSSHEQRMRMRSMRDVVRHQNVYRWAGDMLLDAAQLANNLAS